MISLKKSLIWTVDSETNANKLSFTDSRFGKEHEVTLYNRVNASLCYASLTQHNPTETEVVSTMDWYKSCEADRKG